MRRPYAGFLAVTALVVLAGQAASQCDNLPCEPRPFANTLTTLNDYGGFSVAVDGDVAVAGAPGDYNSPYPFGAAYVYERQPSGEWVAVTRLEKANVGTMDEQFGFSVDIVGDTILVGDPVVYENGIGSGAAYIFERPAGGWADLDVDMDGIRDAPLTESAKLLATTIVGPPGNQQDNSNFQCGRSVALAADGATAYVGVPKWNDNVSFSGRRTEGRVCVFRRPGTSWGSSTSPPTLNETAQLGREEELLPEFTSLGWSLDVIANPGGGDRVVTGAVSDNAASSGTHHGVWVFDEPAMGWESSMTLQYGIPVNYAPAAMSGPDPTTTRHSFGESVAFLDVSTVAVGSPSERGAHVYSEFAPDTWVQEGPLIEPCVTIDPFGTGVAFAQDGTLLVGSGLGNGVFTYERVPDPDIMNQTGMMWTGLNRILPRVAVTQNNSVAGGFNSLFGHSVAVGGGRCLAGMPLGFPGQPNRPGLVYELDMDCDCVMPIVTPMGGMTNWWTGDTDYMDLVGGQHGTPLGNTNIQNALAGSGFNYDSVDDAVNLGTTAGNFGTGDFTAELWAYLAAEGSNIGYSVLLEKFDGSQGWWIDNVNFGSNLRFVADSGGPHIEFSASGIITFDPFRWTHFAVTREGLTYRLYVNGEEVASTVATEDLDLSSAAPLYLGANQSLTGSVNGYLDEVALYDVALSQEEIREIVFAYGAGRCKDIDFVPPIITITSPMDGDLVHGSVNFDATVTDASDVEVFFLVDGVPLSVDPQTDAPFEEPLNTAAYSDGLHVLTVEATDTNDNFASDSIIVTFDNNAPTVVITTPLDGATVSGQFHFQTAVTDGAGSGLTSVSMLVNGVAPNVFNDSVVEFDPPEMATARRSLVNAHRIVGDTVVLSVTATDAAGHVSMEQATVTINRGGGRARHHNGDDLEDAGLSDVGLVVDTGRGPVTALVPLGRTRLELTQPHAFELRVKGGQPVRALAHRVLKGTEPSVMLAFDRRQLIASVAAAIAAGEIQLRSGIEVELYVDGVRMGVNPLRSGPDGERR